MGGYHKTLLAAAHRAELVRALHAAAARFPDVDPGPATGVVSYQTASAVMNVLPHLPQLPHLSLLLLLDLVVLLLLLEPLLDLLLLLLLVLL